MREEIGGDWLELRGNSQRLIEIDLAADPRRR